MYLKISCDFKTLERIKEDTQYILGSTLGDNLRQRIEEWKPNYDARIIRRFISGNILNGIVTANEKKRTDEITGWSLVRYTNYDGSIETSIELRYNRPISEKAIIVPEKTELSVAVTNVDFMNFFDKVAITTNKDNEKQVFPLWNIETDRLIDRALCIMRMPNDIMEVEIMQAYKEKKDTGEITDYDEKHEKYNKLFHDDDLLKKYAKHQVKKGQLREQIKYAKKVLVEINKYGQREEKPKYSPIYRTSIKSFVFNINTDEDVIKEFLGKINSKYDLSFNFRASDEDYYNIQSRQDIQNFKNAEKEKLFPEGDYEYLFTEPVTDAFINQIPEVKERTVNGAYGGIILSQPFTPTMVASYKLKPLKLQYDVLLNLTISNIPSDALKLEFAKKLEEIQDKSALDIGLYVEGFLSKNVLAPKYFFGDMRVSEYGTIFKEYAQKNDITKIVIADITDDVALTNQEPPNNVVDFDGAESFLINMITL
jgi:hypothetical protein